ncbi:MAG: hypothetical protein H6726_25425 [Sandaracinaceae bacterium]|nr:hypothetical protein [Myxococcales bacterium]MCA9575703.1 hypothetical protein [Myxococcales bacterium]MCB9661013.1 hypothetical protein [Sandaracinaceae bacterium]
MTRQAQVLVLGASGELGARVVRLLGTLAPQVPCVRASRRGREGCLALDVTQPPPAGLLGAGDVVIDVVGPYEHDPSAWVRACGAAQAHFVDLSERPEFIERVARAGEDSPCAVLSGCSTVPALAASLLRDMADGAPDGDDTERVEVLLSMGSRHRPSRGLVYSLLRPLGRALPEDPKARAFRGLTTRTLTSGVRRRYGRFPCPDLGLGCPVRFWSGFDRGALVWALSAVSWVTPWVPSWLLLRVAAPLSRVAAVASLVGGEAGSLRLERHRRDGAPDVLEIHAARDGLDVPALPAVWAAMRLVGQTTSRARRLDEVIDAPAQRAALEQSGYVVHRPSVSRSR